MSKKIVLNAGGNAATVSEATLTDMVTTLFSPDSAVTGLYKYGQLALVGAAGMMYGNKRHSGSFLNFGGGFQ